jgi:predicted ester cyclase
VASEYVVHWNGLKPSDSQRTAEDLKKLASNWQAAFPDLEVKIDDMAAEGDKVAYYVTFTGTHTGHFGENYPPTNKRCRITFPIIARIADGKVVERSLASGIRRYFRDMLGGTLFKAQEEAQGT